MRKHNLAFIDIETTGLDVLKHEIIEIGCVITTPRLRILEKFELKIKPKHIKNADPVSMKINHYNKKDWKDAYKIEEALQILARKVEGCIMVGQNVSFDSLFLEFNFSKLNLKNSMHYHKLDTISIAWAKFHKKSNIKHFSLREMCKRFDIINEHPHSALSDAYATYRLYKKLMGL